MKHFYLASILCAFVFFTSCKKDSSEVDQEQIFQSYTMTYDEDANETTVYARFFEEKLNGKALELSNGSTVSMNGTVMKKSGTSYYTTVSGNLALASIIFTDTEGKKYTNTISKVSYIANEATNYQDNSFTDYWYWNGSQIAAGETVKLVFTNVDDTSISASFEENVVGRSYVTMPYSSLSTLPAGDAKVEISRTKTINTGDFSSVGGKIVVSYKALYNYVEIY